MRVFIFFILPLSDEKNYNLLSKIENMPLHLYKSSQLMVLSTAGIAYRAKTSPRYRMPRNNQNSTKGSVCRPALFKKTVHMNLNLERPTSRWLVFVSCTYSINYNIGCMGLLPDMWYCGLRMRRECRERFRRQWLQRKPLVSDPGMHHGTCVMHVPWCMSGSLTPQWRGKRSRHSRRMRNFMYLARGPYVV